MSKETNHKNGHMEEIRIDGKIKMTSIYGRKNGSRAGLKRGGRGRNRTSVCRHPKIKKSRR